MTGRHDFIGHCGLQHNSPITSGSCNDPPIPVLPGCYKSSQMGPKSHTTITVTTREGIAYLSGIFSSVSSRCPQEASEYYSVQNKQPKTRAEFGETLRVSVIWWYEFGFRIGKFHVRNQIPPYLVCVTSICAWCPPNLPSGLFVDVSRKFREGNASSGVKR
ncbi:hypothetical protein AVEN_60504-1 [Araneus ventricosus]|uniref:Uncharacterized protein n=1 Tax=Araneus ventricosus TaxID=182803 RepID=A0A4Y2GCP8_ARAVE|nr:hypothetical protein AVEN_60504-1 [Araneus ventricosus]